jgi:hypothetical protein|tara:strand:- start:390 stop:710 length:321 start_codon:yes stop_codon:yes gene_type:complete
MEEQEIQDKLNQHRINKAETGNKDSSTKFTNEELKAISDIKQSYDSLTLRMGQIHFELKSLTSEKENVENLFSKNRDEEVQFAQDLTSKYGKGSLDIETGIFTPSE